MRTVFGFPSYGSLATWSAITNTWSTSYPLSNLSALATPRRVSVAAATGAAAMSFAFSAAKSVQLVSLIGTNLTSSATLRVRLYSDNLTTMVADSGTVSAWPTTAPLSQYGPPTRPVLFSSPVSALTGRIDITPGGSDPAVQIASVDISGSIIVSDIMSDLQRGFATSGFRVAIPGGIDVARRQWQPRSFVGNRAVVAQSEIDTTWLDFQSDFRLSTPFVFCRDIDDSTCWPREAFQARNAALNPLGMIGPMQAKISISITEHLG